MSKTGFKKTGCWKTTKKAFDPRLFDKTFRKHMMHASGTIGFACEAFIRKIIQRGGFEPNKPLTVSVKKSEKPLVDSGELFQSITHEVVDEFNIFVGISKTDDIYNVAVMIHEGGSITVTSKMRGLFWVLWLTSQGKIEASTLSGRARELWDRMPGDWKPISTETKAIIMPSRPFIRQAFQDPELSKIVLRYWNNAVRRAIGEMAKCV